MLEVDYKHYSNVARPLMFVHKQQRRLLEGQWVLIPELSLHKQVTSPDFIFKILKDQRSKTNN